MRSSESEKLNCFLMPCEINAKRVKCNGFSCASKLLLASKHKWLLYNFSFSFSGTNGSRVCNLHPSIPDLLFADVKPIPMRSGTHTHTKPTRFLSNASENRAHDERKTFYFSCCDFLQFTKLKVGGRKRKGNEMLSMYTTFNRYIHSITTRVI